MKKKMHQLLLLICDIVVINLSFIFALYIRFDGNILSNELAMGYLVTYFHHAVIICLIKIVIYRIFRLYHSLWRYASIDELFQVVIASFMASAVTVVYCIMVEINFPRSIVIIVPIFDVIMLSAVRFSYRSLRAIKDVKLLFKLSTKKRLLVIGAGAAGAQIIKEIKGNDKMNCAVVALIDDNPLKKGLLINGIPIIGGRDQIELVVKEKKIDLIMLAIPSATREEVRAFVDICSPLKVELKILPDVRELINSEISLKQSRNVIIEDLLGREPVKLDFELISAENRGKIILVSGGGGSIGSELCRQIANFKPHTLIIVDIYENNAYDIQQELKKIFNDKLKLYVHIASVRDITAMDYIFKLYKPDIVFHAAAHKHVPLMEAAPFEAIKNNVFGTENLAKLSLKYDVKKFVLISTDKAVNPTNIMGASKRLAELIIQDLNSFGSTEFVIVRFGNVLGSNGSVVPIFKKQIAEGGPVCVTHPEIIRYFMTIPEAAGLVLQAASFAKGGEVFVLDMGRPVKILDLAYDLIRLSGYEPNKDIGIVFTGLRPGEKLYEELLTEQEGLKHTINERIMVCYEFDKIKAYSIPEIVNELRDVIEKSNPYDYDGRIAVDKILISVIPTYVPSLKKLEDLH